MVKKKKDKNQHRATGKRAHSYSAVETENGLGPRPVKRVMLLRQNGSETIGSRKSVQRKTITMAKTDQKLTLYRPMTYQIKVPGYLDKSWSDWAEGMTIAVESAGDRPPITILTGSLDQAALHGLLRRLYSLGLPLISVNLLDCR